MTKHQLLILRNMPNPFGNYEYLGGMFSTTYQTCETLHYHIFSQVKNALGGKKFQDYASLKQKVAKIGQNVDGKWYSLGIEKLIHIMIHTISKCLKNIIGNFLFSKTGFVNGSYK